MLGRQTKRQVFIMPGSGRPQPAQRPERKSSASISRKSSNTSHCASSPDAQQDSLHHRGLICIGCYARARGPENGAPHLCSLEETNGLPVGKGRVRRDVDGPDWNRSLQDGAQ